VVTSNARHRVSAGASNPIGGAVHLAGPGAGLATDGACGRDVEGRPRRVAGHLGPLARVDMGAHEFSHVSLSAFPASAISVQIDASGTPGLFAFLWVGFGESEICLPPAGALLFDPSLPYVLVPWGPLPQSRVASAFLLPPGVTVRLQAMVVAGASGNLSGPHDLGGE